MSGIVLTKRPLPPPPDSLTDVQFFLVADSIGYSQADIEALIIADNTLTEDERRGLLIRLRRGRYFPRAWPHIEMLAPDLTAEQIDDLYRMGAEL